MISQITTVNILLICCGMVAAKSVNHMTTNRCAVYKEGETLPPPPTTGDRECFHVFGDSNRYCIDYGCPDPGCSNPIQPENGCPYCTGTCVQHGKVRKVGESYTCADGCNICACDENGVSTTWMMCYSHEPPKECRSI